MRSASGSTEQSRVEREKLFVRQMIRRTLWRRKVILQLDFGGPLECPQAVCPLGREDYRNKSIWKTQVHDFNIKRSICVGWAINIVGLGHLSVK